MISDDDDDDDYDFDYDDVLTIEPFRCKKTLTDTSRISKMNQNDGFASKPTASYQASFFPLPSAGFNHRTPPSSARDWKSRETVGEQLTTDANVASLDQHLGGRNPAPPWMVEILYMYMYM